MTSGNSPGFLIVFEGTDGTGKSTQLELLRSVLQKQGFEVIATREPTDGKYGRQIRELYSNRHKLSLEDELELFLADRKDHIESLIAPALAAGKIVLCDRYYLSTVAYQGAAGLNPDTILQRNHFAPSPDIALLFQAPIETGIKRITQGRGDTLNDFEKADYLLKVASEFEQLTLPCIQRIDASASIDAVHREVLNHVLPLLKK